MTHPARSAFAFTIAALAVFATAPLQAGSHQTAPPQVSCATEAEADDVTAYFADNHGLPAIAAQRLGLAETVVASALPAGDAIGTDAGIFNDVWTRLTELDSALILVLKEGHVFEMRGPIPPGTPSTRSNYFNVEFPEEEAGAGDPDGFSGHLRPDLLTAIYAFKLPGEGGVPVRSLFFYGPSGNSDFGVVLAAGESEESAANRAAFEEIWQMIAAAPRLCG